MIKSNFTKYLDIDDFLPEDITLVKEFKCNLCEGIAYNPVQDSCYHLYCLNCYQKADKCPITGSSLIRNVSTDPSNFITKILSMKLVYCKNKQSYCEWTGPLADLDTHLKENCSKQLRACK